MHLPSGVQRIHIGPSKKQESQQMSPVSGGGHATANREREREQKNITRTSGRLARSSLAFACMFSAPSFLLVDISRCQAAENLWLDTARASITTGELSGHVGVLADDTLEGREAGSRGGRVAAKYIIDRLKEAQLIPAGKNDRFTQPFGRNYQNLLALIEGSDPELRDEYLIVGAHYDHVGYGNGRNSFGPIGYIHNGADDNASGVAAVLEVIDAMVGTEFRPRRSILFAFWDGEEKGLLGSKHWASQPTLQLDAVRLAINIDMVGRVDGGRIEVGGTRTGAGFRRLFSSPSLSAGTWLDFSWEYKDNSDHYTFFQAGVPSLYLHSGLHDDYHRPSDDVEKLNVEGMREISRYLLEKLSELADAQQLPTFRSQARFENPQVQQRTEKPLPAMPSRLGFQWDYIDGPTGVAVIRRIGSHLPAFQVGLRRGDRIVALEGQPLTSDAQIPTAALRNEKELRMQVMSVGSDQRREVTVPLQGSPVRMGLSWRDDPVEPGTVYLTRVVPFSAAAAAGLKLHDRIHALEGEPVEGQDNLLSRVESLLENGATEIRLRVESRGILQELVLRLGNSANQQSDPTL